VVSLFKLLQKSNKLKFLEVRCPDKVGKTDDPNFYLYQRMLGHPIKNCYIFTDVLQALIDADVLKLCPEQKKVTVNMTSLQFDKELPSVLAGVIFIPKRELRLINIDPHNKKEKGLVPVPTPRGEIMWVHPDNIKSQQWTTIAHRKFKGKAKASSNNMVGISTRETEEDVASLTSSGEEKSALAAKTGFPSMSKTQPG